MSSATEKRNTIQRNLVFKAVQNRSDHPTADIIYDELRKKNPRISRGTVYRNLNVLDELGEIKILTLPFGPKRFECRLDMHDHFSCKNCKKVIDIKLPPEKCTYAECADLKDCRIEDRSLVLTGLCSVCLNAKL